MKRIIFARIGWMKYYKGPQRGDPRPIGGGEYNVTKIGYEAFNFKKIGGRFLGFVQYGGRMINLMRIDPKANLSYLDDVLVIFVARHPTEYGQRVIGWYSNARVLKQVRKKRMRQRMGFSYNIIGTPKSSVLLPTKMRTCEVPSGRNGLGQSNITYVLDYQGGQKKMPWLQSTLDYINDYDGPNLITDEDSELDQIIAEIYENEERNKSGQGFIMTSEVREAIEKRAMAVSVSYYEKRGYVVVDVSKKRSYDLYCKRGKNIIFVEVKGSQNVIERIFLTNNEKVHAINNARRTSLCLVSKILVEGRGKHVRGYGGQLRTVFPWHIKKENLKALCYVYQLKQNEMGGKAV